jgi:hypothetical protein
MKSNKFHGKSVLAVGPVDLKGKSALRYRFMADKIADIVSVTRSINK